MLLKISPADPACGGNNFKFPMPPFSKGGHKWSLPFAKEGREGFLMSYSLTHIAVNINQNVP